MTDVAKLQREFEGTAKTVLRQATQLNETCKRYKELGTQLGIAREQSGPGSILNKNKLAGSVKAVVIRLLESLELHGFSDAKRHFTTNGLRLPGVAVEGCKRD